VIRAIPKIRAKIARFNTGNSDRFLLKPENQNVTSYRSVIFEHFSDPKCPKLIVKIDHDPVIDI